MKLNELETGSKLNLALSVDGEILQFTSKIAVILPDSVLVEPILKDDKTIGFENHDVQVIYAAQDEKPVVWLKTKMLLVKYKDAVYHQIISDAQGQPFNRRADYRMYVGINGKASYAGATHNVMIKNISANGIAFISDFQINTGGTIRIRFKDMGHEFALHASVCWSLNEENSTRYIYGCKITARSKNIEAYISEKQRISMQNKLATNADRKTMTAREQDSDTKNNIKE